MRGIQFRLPGSALLLLLVLGLAGCFHSGLHDLGDVLLDVDFNQFNGDVDAFEQRVSDLIDQATHSIDVAVYRISLDLFLTALEGACSRGVLVRVLSEYSHSLSDRDNGCIDLKFASNSRLMHHKFMIVDRDLVWTSSANWTETSFYLDANNSVVLRSPQIARVYQSEFDQMFESGRFGTEKTDSNTERFRSSELELEIHFSPSDNPRERILELINQASSSIKLAVYAMTDNEIYEALQRAMRRGVRIDALWDFLFQNGCQYTEADEWLRQGIGIVEAMPGLLHHKFAVIDEEVVITGSANWSLSGMERNDENVLIIHSQDIAALYTAQFDRIKSDAIAQVQDPESPPRIEGRHFENLSSGALLQWRPHELGAVDGYEICRYPNSNNDECDQTWSLPAWSWYFVDSEAEPDSNFTYTIRNKTQSGQSAYSEPHQPDLQEETLPLLSAAETISDFTQFEDQYVQVRYLVTEAFVSDQGNLFLNSGEDHRTDYTTFIPSCAMERFTGSGIDLFNLDGREILVSGELIEFNGPEIIVTSPWQIAVIEN